MYLIDSSVWIEFFSKKSTFNLETTASPHEIFIIQPIYQEVLQGIKDEKAFRAVSRSLLSANFVENPLTFDVTEEAISIYRIARKSGITIRSSVDCLIAACAIRNNLIVLHKDRDFTNIATFTALKAQAI
ncbi:MAG: PIN domain-containing protein [Leptospirales bacterium]